MFLRKLKEDEKIAFLSMAFKIINSDNHLSKAELERVEEIRVECALYQETALKDGTIEELCDYFKSEESKSAALIEAVRLAYIDGNYSEEEQKILRAMALAFGFNEEKATNIENWVVKFNEIIKEGENIIRG